eukprot:snap_masked-scaffold_12-processed-gene-4.16-mRNA-1 protein AED:1.00 eAED:1.00 QI:0/0/0/0/1/1/2/0/67
MTLRLIPSSSKKVLKLNTGIDFIIVWATCIGQNNSTGNVIMKIPCPFHYLDNRECSPWVARQLIVIL